MNLKFIFFVFLFSYKIFAVCFIEDVCSNFVSTDIKQYIESAKESNKACVCVSHVGTYSGVIAAPVSLGCQISCAATCAASRLAIRKIHQKRVSALRSLVLSSIHSELFENFYRDLNFSFELGVSYSLTREEVYAFMRDANKFDLLCKPKGVLYAKFLNCLLGPGFQKSYWRVADLKRAFEAGWLQKEVESKRALSGLEP